MQKILMVPLHTDALYLRQSTVAVGPTADFRGLPYYSRQERRDVNSDTAWLSDSAVAQPFENSNMLLQDGVHLHWSLPDGLCHGKAINDSIEMPAVPNRWLIRRRPINGGEEKIWVVESDYVWPETNQAPAVNVFQTLAKSSKRERPYRFLGRKLTWDEWKADGGSHDYLQTLTAIGYGEPTFAAYYPNCMTVFGFHDRDLPKTWDSLQYDLIGWYGNGTTQPELSWEQDQLSNSWIEHLRGWRVNGEQPPQTPIMCYSSIKLIRTSEEKSSKETSTEPLASDKASESAKVALGNTLSEALSALLANEIAEELTGSKNEQSLVGQIEEQLEALYIHEQLSSEVQDLGLRLRRYRHQKSFDPVQAGNRWTVHTDQPGVGALSENVLQTLQSLNAVQAQYDRQVSELAQARRRLYGDWCHYMRCVYRPPDGGRGQFLDIDEVVNYIETRSLKLVETLSCSVAETRKRRSDLESQLTSHITRLNLEAEQAAKTQQAQEPGTPVRPIKYSLRSEPGARFWQPTEPVVLMTGGRIQINDRHGCDGRNAADGMLQCQIYEATKTNLDEAFKSKSDPNPILEWVHKRWQEEPPGADGKPSSCIGFREVKVAQPPWNPLLLDWGIDLHPAESHAPGTSGHYDSDIITGNYVLGSQNPDLIPGTLWVNDNPDRFSGRCILGDTPSLVLRERIEDVLQQRLIGGKPELWANPQETEYHRQISEWWNQGRPTSLPTTYEALHALLNWYKARPHKPGPSPQDTPDKAALTKPKDSLVEDPLYCTLLAYKKLFEGSDTETNTGSLQPRAFLGQSLGGFNGELIQWKLGLALPIDEPIGMEPYRTFTHRVAAAVGTDNEWITEPTNPFSPIRSGALKLDRLRIIDSFGQIADLPCDDQVIVPTPYQTPGRQGVAFLPPRLVQPAQVTFRWLDARPEEPGEMVEVAARSPICGWLLPEKLRGQLLVFAGDGNPLGALAADKTSNTLEWVRAPGFPRFSDDECEAGRKWLQSISDEYYRSATNGRNAETLRDLGELGANLQNPRLARVLLYLWATQSSNFLERFLNTLDDAMANIDPEGTVSMGSLALLVGRPVAVVGAEFNLELKDKPAVRQDWGAFRLDQYRTERDTEEFERVQFRFRLGQYNSRNDGIVGYWLEEPDGFEQNTFVAQAADDDDPTRRLELSVSKGQQTFRINAHDQGDKADDLNFTHSIANASRQATLLMDPRGHAHLTTGILPVKSIDIPRHLWEPALEAMRLWFSVAPILTRPRSRRVPIPTLVDRQWSWLEQVKTQGTSIWQTLYPRPSVDRDALRQKLFRLNAELGRVPLVDYDLILRGPTQGKELVIARKIQSEQETYYLVRIFDQDGKQFIREIGKRDRKIEKNEQQKLTEAQIVRDLDQVLVTPKPSDNQKRVLVEKITSYSEYGNASYELILRGSQSTDTLPTSGKSLIVARKVKNEDRQYLISIFDGAGHQVTTDQILADGGLVGKLDNKLKCSELLDHQGRELTQEILMTFYNLMLRKAHSTDALPTKSENLVTAQQLKNGEDDYYLINIFDEDGNQVVKDKKITDQSLVSELNQVLEKPDFLENTKHELLQKIAFNLGYGRAELILRRSQSTNPLPAEGKNLVISRQVSEDQNNSYNVTIFNSAGKQVEINQNLTNQKLVTVLEFRELGRDITSNLGYIHPELDRLIAKKWLEEMEPPGDRLYVNPKEDRQPLEDWALETLLDAALPAISLALVSPGEEVDFNPGIEVREGWLLLTPGNERGKT